MNKESHRPPRLTIVIPTLNRAYCLGRAIDSAIAQTSLDIEIIVSDNGSSDNTPDIIARYNDPRLRLFRRENTIPADAHGNFLISEAKGEFFLGLSDDDYLEPEFSSRILAIFDKNPDLSFAYSGCWIHYAEVAVPSITGPEIEDGLEFIAAHYENQRGVCWCACVTRLADLRNIGPIPAGQIFGDMYYWTKIAFFGKVGCVNEPLSHYTLMSDNLSSATPIVDWGRESSDLANEALIRYQACCQDKKKCSKLRHAISRYLAQSVGNQFIWSALRGASKLSLLSSIPKAFIFLSGALSSWLHVMASLLLSKSALRELIIIHAWRQATERNRQGHPKHHV